MGQRGSTGRRSHSSGGMGTRAASHAGSWYSDKPTKLAAELTKWLDAAGAEPAGAPGATRALIAPHAGYAYSGPTAAFAYRHVDPSRVRRVFILGPSHHVYTRACALTAAHAYATPLGDIAIDRETTDALGRTGEFEVMAASTDEDEHSIELHLPYVQHVMRGHPFALVPVLVGALSADAEARYGRVLAPYLCDASTLLVVSSDFCHWGRRFNYTRYDPTHEQICQSIEALDRRGMALIEKQDPGGFLAYQKEFGNTICGQHPIAVLLHALQALAERPEQHGGPVRHELRFVRYAQSQRVQRPDESSVSYAAALVTRG